MNTLTWDEAEKSESTDRLPGYEWQELREKVFARDNYKCVKCKRNKAHVCDHILPVSLGGTNEENNLQSLCKACNKIKTRQDIEVLRRANKIKKIKSSILR